MPAVIASGTSPNTYTLTANRPSGTVAGDLLVAFVSSDGDNITLGAPGGFVDIGGTTGLQRTVRAWYKIATNSEPSTYTFSSSSTNAYRVAMVRITGAPTSSPIAQGVAWGGVNGSSTNISVPQRTAPSSGALQLALISYAAAGDITLSVPSGWSTPHVTTTNNMALIAGRSVSAGTTPASTFTLSSSPYNHTVGSLLISSGQVVSISRSITPTKEFFRGPFAKLFGGSITPAGVVNTMRVVVRTFARSSTPVGTLSRSAIKTFESVINTYGGYAKVTAKLLEASITPTGTVRRSLIRVFTATVTPITNLLTQNAGRLFGAPGIVDITVRLAGEIRARVRRR